MIIDALLPISFTGWDFDNNEAKDYIFWGVNFIEDFGPWFKDEFCHTLKFKLSEAKIVELRSDGSELKSALIGLVVRESTENRDLPPLLMNSISETDDDVIDITPEPAKDTAGITETQQSGSQEDISVLTGK